MVKSVVAAVSLTVLFATYSYGGSSGNYVGMSTGWLITKSNTITDRNNSSATLTYDTGFPFSFSFGHQFKVGLRIEEELFYKKTTADSFSYAGTSHKISSDVQCGGALSNLYYDWYHDVTVMSKSHFSPYVVAGIGIANVEMSEGVVNSLKLWNGGSDSVFAYQIGIGSGIPIRDNVLFDVSYRYFDAQRIHIDKITTNVSSHNVLLGVRYVFK